MAWPALLWAGEVVVPMVRQKESEVNDMQEHGGDIYTNDGLFDFSANINPLGPGEKVMKALQESILKVTAYPDPLCRKLRESAAKRESVPPDSCVSFHLRKRGGGSDLYAGTCGKTKAGASVYSLFFGI